MSAAPDVSMVNETLGKRKGSGTREADTFSDWPLGAASLVDEITVPCVTDNQYTLDLYKKSN